MQSVRFLLACCVLVSATFAAKPEDDFQTQELNTAEVVENGPKINWGPVWDELEYPGANLHLRHHMEGHLDNFSGDHELHMPVPYDGPKVSESCSTNNYLGIHKLLKESQLLLPVDKIREILVNATSDAEVQAFLQLIQSADYIVKMRLLRNSRDYQILADYSCRILHLDLKFYADYIRRFLSIPDKFVESPTPGSSIRGLLQDLREILPKKELMDTYQQLSQTDPSLREAITGLQSKEYRTLLQNVRTDPRMQELKQMFAAVGVPFDDLENLIKTALGLDSLDLGVEHVLLNF